MAAPPSALRRAALLLLSAAGVYAAYLTQGYVQEAISTREYAPSGARFAQLKALHGLQSFGCFVTAGLVLLAFPGTRGGAAGKGKGGKEAAPTAPLLEFLKPSITNSIGPALGIMALKNIPFSSQVLVKSCKMVTVMIGNTLVSGTRYSAKEYACAALIAGGLSLFSLQGSGKAASKLADPNMVLGYGLCLVNLSFDGYTNSYQDNIKMRYQGTTAFEMMCWMNFWCALMVGTYTFGISSAGGEIAAFCLEHPDALRDIITFCICGAVGQLFIFLTIVQFGSLTNTIVTTARKFFSILISTALSGSPLVPLQWAGVACVFAGLAGNIYLKALKARGQGPKGKKKKAALD